MVKRKEATKGIYLGSPHEIVNGASKNYPVIKNGDKGYYTDLHKWEQEKYQEKRFAFYPNNWGNIYYFIVMENEVKKNRGS